MESYENGSLIDAAANEYDWDSSYSTSEEWFDKVPGAYLEEETKWRDEQKLTDQKKIRQERKKKKAEA